MNLSSYILPYPYKAYTKYNRSSEEFEHYKDKIFGWVEENTSKTNISSSIDSAFSYAKNTEYNNNVKAWLLLHSDKVRYIGDFSGLEFGIQIIEATETLELRFPTYIDEHDKQLYPLYDENLFKNLDIIDKLEWMYTHCEFIPFRVIYESIDINGYSSYKFSHIKRDTFAMNFLKGYIESLDFPPRDDVYYFICWTKFHGFHLKRDLVKSPKHK